MRDMNFTRWTETVLQDLRYALRQFVHNPVFTVVAVLSLALGIGANTAIFSIFNATMFKSLPVRDANELMVLTNPNASGVSVGMDTGERNLLSYAEFTQLRDHITTMSGLCASESSLNRWEVRIAGSSQEEARGRLVTEEYFSVLGVEPAIGRFFTSEAGAGPGSDPYAVISYGYWQRRFGGNTSVLGTPIRLYQTTVTVIGVAAPGFQGETVGEAPDFWVPMMMELQVKPGRDWLHEDLSKDIEKVMWLHAFGRLKPGVTKAKAQAEIDVLFKGIIESGYPASLSAQARKEALDQHLLLHDARTGAFGGRDEFSRQLLIVMAFAGIVLLIACANVANLLLARATARYKEVGVRLSLGAAKGRLVRQFMTESLLLAIFGGVVGVFLAMGSARLLVRLLSGPRNPLHLSTSLDLRVLAFTAGASLLTGLLFGLAPALRSTRVDINDSLRETGRGVTTSSRRLTLAKTLVILQVTFSLLAVVGAGLFLRTLWNLQAVGLGYPKENLLLVGIDGTTAGYKDARLANLYHDIQDRIRALPGVRGATYSGNGLFSGSESGDQIEVEGFTAQKDNDRGSRFDQIGPGYFSTVGIPMLLGREVEVRDTASSPRVCIINEAFAQHFFKDRNPIGKHITQVFGDNRSLWEIIGVSRNARDHRLRDDVPPRFYEPVDQSNFGIPGAVNFEIRTVGDPEQMLGTIRKAVLDLNGDIPVVGARPLGELLDRVTSQPRMIAQLCTILGLIALLMAATGLYGVLSYGVARRTNEIGIRMALGAGRSRVIGMILRETGIMIAVGLTVGMIAAAAATRLIKSWLYGLSALDPLTIAAAICVLGVVALVAGYIPAARAARVNPVTALRHE
jgi:predicted permease